MPIKYCKKCGCETERYASGDCRPCKLNRDKRNRVANAAYERSYRLRDPAATKERDARHNRKAASRPQAPVVERRL